MASILGFYSLYNFLGIIWGLEILIKKRKKFIKALWVYIPFALIFLILALMNKLIPVNLSSFLSAIVMIAYFIIYFISFKGWFKDALSKDPPDDSLAF